MKFCDVSKIVVRPADTLRRAMQAINDGTRGIVLVVDADRRMLGTLTDGDVRRALLAEENLEAPVSRALACKTDVQYANPVTAPAGTPAAALLQLLRAHNVRQIPLLDADGCVVDLATTEDLVPGGPPSLAAIVMAGGLGTRLRPLTDDLPKPMLLVGDKPLMERIIDQLRQAGIRRVSVTTHYKPETIINHFGDGQRFGVEIAYVNEERPLGTAGALGLMDRSDSPLLVINGDILTNLNYRALLDFHLEHSAAMTVGVRPYEYRIPYGVVEREGPDIRRITEKPLMRLFINAGVYLLDPDASRYIPKGERFHMTDLVERLLADGQRVVSFPITEYWLDIGQHADYERAQQDIQNGVVYS